MSSSPTKGKPKKSDRPRRPTSGDGKAAAQKGWPKHEKRTNLVSHSLQQRVANLSDRLFVERELFLRSDGRVRYLRISRKLQISAAAMLTVAFVWIAFSSLTVAFHQTIVSGKETEIERQRLAYVDLLSEVSDYHEEFTQITRNLEENQDYLLSLLARGEEAFDELSSLRSELRESQSERARILLAREGLRRRLDTFQTELSQTLGGTAELEDRLSKLSAVLAPDDAELRGLEEARRRLVRDLNRTDKEIAEVSQENNQLSSAMEDLGQQLTETSSERDELIEERGALTEQVAELERQVTQADLTTGGLNAQIVSLEEALAAMRDRSDQVVVERNELQTRIAGLEQRLVDMRETQQSIVDRLSERTLVSIDAFEQTVAMTGLDIESLLASAGGESQVSGQGGPFIPGDFVVEQDPLHSLQASIAMLDLQMDRWEGLQEVVRSIPLTSPLDQFRITSTFGKRRDPVNGRVSRHYGLDLAAPMRTPVMVTAPGKVVFAGWKGRFGRVIVVDHGHGIRTRYAHLRKILVKVGQKVGHREKIGLLGSSGRSTGPHVHYEVQLRGKPLDPMKFLQAGKHVFKG